jgi:hypothetical protein
VIDFVAFPKIPRLKRDIVISEKIDGTNACVVIDRLYANSSNVDEARRRPEALGAVAVIGFVEGDFWLVGAQSRNRLIYPGKDDNAGFAGWVRDNAQALVAELGEGRHYGEWWGQGIQRGYGLTEKRLSLFNAHRWGQEDLSAVPGLGVVPVLYSGPMSDEAIEQTLTRLRVCGSVAAPGFDRPEGVVVYHAASRSLFKVMAVGDAMPKSAA